MSDKRGSKSTEDPSLPGIFVPMLSILLLYDKINTTTDEWNDNTLKMVKSCKPGERKTYDHHTSLGRSYSFGNEGIFYIVGNSYDGVYANQTSMN